MLRDINALVEHALSSSTLAILELIKAKKDKITVRIALLAIIASEQRFILFPAQLVSSALQVILTATMIQLCPQISLSLAQKVPMEH